MAPVADFRAFVCGVAGTPMTYPPKGMEKGPRAPIYLMDRAWGPRLLISATPRKTPSYSHTRVTIQKLKCRLSAMEQSFMKLSAKQ